MSLIGPLCHACTFSHHNQKIATIIHKNNEINDKFYRKVAFLMYTEIFNFRPIRNKNYADEWALGCHPRDNDHVTS